MILLVAATRSNRVSIRSAGPTLVEAFPWSTRLALAALAAGRIPDANAIILL